MNHTPLRQQVVDYGIKMTQLGLTAGSGGNLSLRCPDGLIAITPSGVDYHDITPEQILLVNTKGEVVEGDGTASSETGMHLALYQCRPDIGAVVHTHSPYATTLACLNMELPATHYLVGFAGQKVPLAPYATFGSPELARYVADAMTDSNAALMANHGLTCVGATLKHALYIAEEIEFCCRVYIQAKSIGEPVILEDTEMDRVIDKFQAYAVNLS
jgi:L-fuculose-phosphate aldolase